MSSDANQYPSDLDADAAWRDVSLPPSARVTDLIGRMRREEKTAQLFSVWIGAAGGDEVAPHQHEFVAATEDFAQLIKSGLGQLTRPFGTAPTDPCAGSRALARMQREVMAAGRFAIPALVHEECLSGFMAAGATVYPTALAWGATFNPDLIAQMARHIGDSMRTVGVHQGLAPVLDVAVDPRWGRTEETMGEDPYLVATLGTAYVQGLQQSGVIATLKHFVGYSGSRDARNFGPVSAGPREVADVFLPPFELAIRDGRPGSVMHSYTEIDGIPAAASQRLLTELLRETWGFDGTVVSDYFGIAFLHKLHRVAADPTEAAANALAAGVDVELPAVDCFGDPLLAALESGVIDEGLIDRALQRVLLQKCRLGLLDPDWEPVAPDVVDLNPAAQQDLARNVAEQSVILLTNNGRLPLPPATRLAVVGPVADTGKAMLGCYTFGNHIGDSQYNVKVPSLLEALRAELPEADVTHAPGCDVSGQDLSGVPDAVRLAESADICVAVVGDVAGLFGRGTSGEGCDREDHRLPGVQGTLVERLLATGTPMVLVVLSGRTYALGVYADRTAAIVQAFFPGQAGGAAVAGVLSGRVNPSGRLPLSVPARAGAPAPSYLSRTLAQRSDVSNIDPTAAFGFGHGLSYTDFTWSDAMLESSDIVDVAGEAVVSVAVTNAGDRAGSEVVQLYLHDPVSQVTQPVQRLVGYARVDIEPGRTRRVRFTVPADLASFTGRAGDRIVEPGRLELWLGASSEDIRYRLGFTLTGAERVLDHRRRMVAETEVA